MSNLPAHSEAVRVRLKPADREVITARATRLGLTVSEYLRRAGLGTLEATPEPTARTVAFAPADVPPNPRPVSKYLRSAPGDDPA